MLKYINYQLHQDNQQQAKLEQALSSQINQKFTSNFHAFSQYIPSVVPLLQQHEVQKHSIFCTRTGELNIVDFVTGRVWYGDSPYTEVQQEVQSFCQQAPYIDLNADNTAQPWSSELLPAQVDVIVMFGLGLGYQLAELMLNARIKYLIVYEPNLDALLCSVQANDWQQLFETAAATGTQIFLQLGNDGSSLPEDLLELQQIAAINRIYLYRHYFHPVMDKVLVTLFEQSGNQAAITLAGQHFGEFDSFYDYLPERAGNAIGNLQPQAADKPEQTLFQQNLNALKVFYPEVYKVVTEHQCRHWKLITDESSLPNLQHQTRLGLFYQNLLADSEQLIENFVHNPYKDDVILGQTISKKLSSHLHTHYVQKLQSYINHAFQEKNRLPEQVDSLIIFGVALGKHIELLTERHRIKNLYICEPNLDFFVLSLYVTNWHQIFQQAEDNDCRIYLNLGGDGSNYFTDLMLQFYKVGAYSIANTYMLSSYFNRDMQKAIAGLRAQLRIVLMMGEYFDHVRFGIAHTYFNVDNHRFLRKNWLQKDEKHDILQLPVFIVANGPSLDSCFEYLHKYQDKVIIISCGTALRALYRNGIKPDFHAEVEQNRATFDWISQVNDPEYLKDIRLISVNGMHPDTAGMFRETLLAFKQGESSTYIFQNGLAESGAEIASLAYSYPTVTNMVTNYLLSAGFRLIYLFGVDLGYVDINYHHSKFSAYYKPDGKDSHDYKNNYGHSNLPVEGNFRPVVFTQPAFDVSRKLVEQALLSFAGAIEVYNCSDGVKIAGAAALDPEYILLADNTDYDKQQLLNQFVADAFFPVFGCAEKIFSSYDLDILRQSINTWLEIIAEDISTQEQAKVLIEAQWQHLRHCGANGKNLTFYLLYGSSNYFLGLLTKLMAGIDENPDLVTSFNEVLQLWRDYIENSLSGYIAEPLKHDQVDVSCLFE